MVRIMRHNSVAEVVVYSLRMSGWSVQSEPKHVVSDETLIPDIVAVRDRQAWVIDVRVSSDSTNRELQYFHDQKGRKYRRADLVARVRLDHPTVQGVDFSSVTVNWRGCGCGFCACRVRWERLLRCSLVSLSVRWQELLLRFVCGGGSEA